MLIYSTNQAAKKLGITGAALSKYIKAGKVPTPKMVRTGWRNVHAWTERDIQQLRKLLPKIANGRKTRYQKQRSAGRSQQAVKAKPKSKPQAKRPVPHKKKK